MMGQVTVRAARLGDEHAIAQARVRGWQVGYAGILPPSLLDSMSVAEDGAKWASRLSEQTGYHRTLVVETSDSGHPQVGGFCSFGSYRKPFLEKTEEVTLEAAPRSIGEIYAFYLHPDHWGSGLADELMLAALAALADEGWARAFLWVLDENSRAREFYARHGWSDDGERQSLAMEGGPVEVRLKRAVRESR